MALPLQPMGDQNAKTFVGKIKSQSDPLLGTIVCLASTTIAQLVAQADGDCVMIDMEHAPLTQDMVTSMVAAYVSASRGAKFPLVRIPSHGVEYVKWALDSGAAGIIVPMVGNVAEMEAIIDRAIYPPGGRRSFGPIYSVFAHPDGPSAAGGMAGYVERAKRGDIALLPMIESKEGLENVEAILGMEHVSGCLIGPADLRLSLGMEAALDGTEQEFLDALKKIVSAAKRAGKIVGTVAFGEEVAKKRTEDGMDYLFTGFDFGAMLSGIASDISSAKRGADAASSQ